MKAVIMAGGQGTRLQPLTFDRPKPMVPILGRPVIEHLILLLRKYGLTDIIIAAYYMPEVIQDALGDGSDYGVQLTYVIEEQPLGTAGCIKQIEQMLTTTFLVLSGDALTDFPLQEAISTHQQNQAMSTIVVTEVSDPTLYGIVTHDERGRVLRFLEKPGPDEIFSNVINTGIYVFEPDILRYCPEGEPFDFSRDLFPTLMENDIPIYTHRGVGYWSDIGNKDQYVLSHMDALERKIALENLPGLSDADTDASKAHQRGKWIHGLAAIDRHAKVIPPVAVFSGAVIEPGATIGPGAVIGENSTIKEGAVVKHSVIWDGVTVGEGAEIRQSAVGSGAVIEPQTVLTGDAVAPGETREPHSSSDHSSSRSRLHRSQPIAVR